MPRKTPNLSPLSDDEVTKLMSSGKTYDDRFDTLTQEEKEAGMHNSDKGKLPNYPTFSDESVYHSPERPGGTWKYLDKDNQEMEENEKGGTWHFYASPYNVMQHGSEGLQKHFRETETGDNPAVLHLPSQNDMQNYKQVIFSNLEQSSSFWAQ
jgi:hypothetical protein